MTRIKRGTIAHKKRERLLKYVKGFRWGRKNKERAAKEALLHAWSRSFRGRKERKRVFRSKWQVQINAAARQEGTTYNHLIAALNKKSIRVNRKMLADLANTEPKTFTAIINVAKN